MFDSTMWNPTGKPAASCDFTDSLRQRLDVGAQHPGHKRIYLRPQPWLSAVGVKRHSPKTEIGEKKNKRFDNPAIMRL
jgi:hypothetical protein